MQILVDVILASTTDGGIGSQGKLPWHLPGELEILKYKTKSSILIIGRKTVEQLPLLRGRIIYCVTSHACVKSKNPVMLFKTLQHALIHVPPGVKAFVAGGAMIYNEMFKDHSHLIDKIHISLLSCDYQCDTFVDIYFLERCCIIEKPLVYPLFVHYVMKISYEVEQQYHNILQDVLDNGKDRMTRNAMVKSMFSKTLHIDLRKGFPLLTTKKMFFRGIVEELLFFVRGNTDTIELENKKVNIWKGNTNREFLDKIGFTERKEGEMGPMYGYQWRKYGLNWKEEGSGIDQLKNIIELIKKDPTSRRILMTDYNPSQVHQGVLYPCHSIILQFYIEDGCLDCYCYNRSSDLFLGLPFNIASTSLLVTLIAKVCNLTPRNITISLGDTHIYQSHTHSVRTQLTRIPYEFPTLNISAPIHTIEDIENLTYTDFKLTNYNHWPSIKADMVS